MSYFYTYLAEGQPLKQTSPIFYGQEGELMKNIILKEWTPEYKPTQKHVFKCEMTETHEYTVSSVRFWFKISGAFIVMTARITTTTTSYPFDNEFILTYEEAKQYFNDPKLFLENNCEQR